jgi:hypothetical protein
MHSARSLNLVRVQPRPAAKQRFLGCPVETASVALRVVLHPFEHQQHMLGFCDCEFYALFAHELSLRIGSSVSSSSIVLTNRHM